MKAFPDWDDRLDKAVAALDGGAADRRAFLTANGGSVARALTGVPVDGGERRPGVGGCVVVNVASAHVPTMTRPGATYKNCYDLDKEGRIGGVPSMVSPKRLSVDDALTPLHGKAREEIYFAAVEFNGCGVGFYGDICLVLRDDVTQSDTVILDRNSYDLIREPLKSRITESAQRSHISIEQARADEARNYAGQMKDDLAPLAAIKVLESRQPVLRLVSTGAVSEGVLDDEDYIEALRVGSFQVDEAQEARLAPADVALYERIRTRELTGDPPSQAEAIWRSRRKVAEGRLNAIGVRVRVVTTSGRIKG